MEITNKIITQAISLGFDFSAMSKDDKLFDCIMYFFVTFPERLEQIEVECQIMESKGRQYANHETFHAYGDLIDWSLHKNDPPGTKIYYSYYPFTAPNGLIKNMNLYHVVK